MKSIRTGTATLGLVVALAAGCAAPYGNVDKAGAGASVTTLTIGTDDQPGRPAADAIEEFARQVNAKSGGTLRLQPRWQAAGEDVDDWDQQVARMITGGRLDMGLIPARAWDTEGVTSLRALNAPFLVTSEEHLRRVLSSDLTGRMLEGLRSIGLTGLALLPEGLRRPFGYDRPLVSPAHYAGGGVRAPHSATVYAMLRALGAKPDDYAGDGSAVDKALADKSLRGLESSYRYAAEFSSMVATGNVTFFPKVNTLVIRSDVLSRLSGDQRKVLADAAASVFAWTLQRLPREADEAERFCAKGGKVLLASAADLRALESAVRPVYAELERDPVTRELISGIRRLAADLPDPPQTRTCGIEREGLKPGPSRNPGPFPEGVYRVEVPVEDLVKAGVGQGDARRFGGVNTLTVKDGTWEWRGPSGQRECGGPASVADGRIKLQMDGICGPEEWWIFTATWTLDGKLLRFLDYQQGDRKSAAEDPLGWTLWTSRPWEKIA
ncbi:TRAP transporter substrate-binding protein [Nonomuraea sp. NPDC059194]|uniref:TRAP transporter substrate-binding protein n=1 Tax=Nonomuraea sp. NPDC059194 TaxID=3346764 RepID=UPI0036A3ED54